MQSWERAAEALEQAEALLVTAGAGMGVDSGLPDFRGPEGFWRAYPPYRALGLRFEELADPHWFEEDPALAWGFYGHRLGLYRATEPHEGFAILRRFSERMERGAFVFTSNVDGQFGKAHFDEARIVECHGSLHWAQCLRGCGVGIFPADFDVPVDETTYRASGPLPSCPSCGGMARPNVLMFGDWGWDPARTEASERRLARWLRELHGRSLVVVELGAGTAVPTVRAFGERVASATGATLVRINLREPRVPAGGISIPMKAAEALRLMEERLA